MARRRCTATRRDGKRCEAFAMASGFCTSHDPDYAEQQTANRAAGGLATRKPRINELLASKLEEHADDIAAVYVRGLNDPDPRVQLQAANDFQAWVLGKPTQRSEVAHSGEMTLDAVLHKDVTEALESF